VGEPVFLNICSCPADRRDVIDDFVKDCFFSFIIQIFAAVTVVHGLSRGNIVYTFGFGLFYFVLLMILRCYEFLMTQKSGLIL
jgi:hypothetical protein